MNTTTVKTVAKNSYMIVISTIVTKGLSLIFIIFVARYLGDIGFGKYSFIFALMSFLTMLIAFGMDGLTIRDIAKDKSQTNVFLTNVNILKIVFTVVAWTILIFLMGILKKEPQINLGIIIIGLCLFPDSLIKSFKAIFSAHEKMEYNTLIEIVFRVIVVSLGLLVIFLNFGFIAILLVSLIASLVTFLYSTYIYIYKIGKIKIEIDTKLCKYLIKTSYMFALIGIFGAIYNRIDTIMLSIMKGDAPVGWYSAAYGLTGSLLFIPMSVCMAVFPVFSRLYKESKESFKIAYEKSFKFLFLLALPIGVGVSILSDRIIYLIYKPEFGNSIIALRILVWATVFIFLSSVMGYVLYSVNAQKVAAITTGSMALVNIVLNYIFIPRFSYIAASWTTVITAIIGFLVYYYYLSRKIYRIGIISLSLKPIVAVLVMGLFLYVFRDLNVFILIIGGCILYILCLMLLKTFTLEDKKLVRQLLFLRS